MIFISDKDFCCACFCDTDRRSAPARDITGKKITEIDPFDILASIPSGHSLIFVATKMIVKNINKQGEEILESIPSWGTVTDMENLYRGERQNEPLYMCYTDEKDKHNPKITSTSLIIYEKSLANEIFGFTPKFVNIDFFSNFLSPTPGVMSVPGKQVIYEGR